MLFPAKVYNIPNILWAGSSMVKWLHLDRQTQQVANLLPRQRQSNPAGNGLAHKPETGRQTQMVTGLGTSQRQTDRHR